MTTGKTDQEFDTFFLAFIGQLVSITVGINSDVNFSDENGATVQSIPMTYEGILLDQDSDYYYLGRTPSEIEQAVRKSRVVHIGIVEQKTLFDEILETVQIPNKKDEIN